MKKIDLSNQRFGQLLVIEEDIPYYTSAGRKKIKWKCQCDCGNITSVEGSNLRNGHTQSCGCKRGDVDHTGEKFGRLIAIQRLNHSYLCQCQCGNITEVQTYNLTNGTTQSCGCLQKDRTREASFKSLIGQRFGKLLVIKQVDNNRFNHTCYLCKCDCGGETIVDSGNLRQGVTSSCGCIKSKGEMMINNLLQKYNISFQSQYSYETIILDSGRHPFFDFAILKNNTPIAFIEYQGKQHYEYSGYGWDNKENYQKTVRRDIQKREWCQKLKIPLYEIPHWEFDNLEKIIYNIIKEMRLLDE